MARKKKDRISISNPDAALVLFLHDRTCCICRNPGRALEIHHIDDDPSNNSPESLAVLCKLCHQETQISGGFSRKLDAAQVLLYKSDWLRIVQHRRSPPTQAAAQTDDDIAIRLRETAEIAELYKTNKAYLQLVILYDSIGSKSLRDKYANLAIKGASDQETLNIRRWQKRLDLVPSSIVERELDLYKHKKYWNMRAMIYRDLERSEEAVENYALTAIQSLREGNPFSAAFYLKQLFESSLVDSLFHRAFEKAERQGNLWWQVRALQELGDGDRLRSLLLKNDVEIEEGTDLTLKALLADAQGNSTRAREYRRQIAAESQGLKLCRIPTPRSSN